MAAEPKRKPFPNGLRRGAWLLSLALLVIAAGCYADGTDNQHGGPESQPQLTAPAPTAEPTRASTPSATVTPPPTLPPTPTSIPRPPSLDDCNSRGQCAR